MASRSYDQFCPLARTLDLLGERWTLLIVRELLCGPKRYTDLLDALPGIWPNSLAPRLTKLIDGGVVEKYELPPPAKREAYRLTERGQQLEGALRELGRWGLPFLDVPTEDQPLTDNVIPYGLTTLLHATAVDGPRLVVDFDLDEARHLAIVGDGHVMVDPDSAPSVDVTARGSIGILAWIARGDLNFDDAIAGGMLTVDGDDLAIRRFAEALTGPAVST